MRLNVYLLHYSLVGPQNKWAEWADTKQKCLLGPIKSLRIYYWHFTGECFILCFIYAGSYNKHQIIRVSGSYNVTHDISYFNATKVTNETWTSFNILL